LIIFNIKLYYVSVRYHNLYLNINHDFSYLTMYFSASKWPGNLLRNYCNRGRKRKEGQHRFWAFQTY